MQLYDLSFLTILLSHLLQGRLLDFISRIFLFVESICSLLFIDSFSSVVFRTLSKNQTGALIPSTSLDPWIWTSLVVTCTWTLTVARTVSVLPACERWKL